MPGEAEAIKRYEKHPAAMPLYIKGVYKHKKG